ncbi:MAG: methyltransferase [Clostridia bacterium]|nr:methyltransferase [Clostridia bacterium]
MSESLLLPGERVDDLQLMGLRVIQSPEAFRFGMDAVLLSDFARVRPRSRVCDLGTGTGILPLLLYGRERSITCDAVEIQPDAAERAQRTMRLNGLESVISVQTGDLRKVRDFLPPAAYDLVVCNPPYSPSAASLPSPKAALRTARQESECTLGDIADAAAWLLRDRARLVLMLPAPRLADAFDTLRSRLLEPKRLRLVHAQASRPARLALIEAMRRVHPGLAVEPPLIVKTPGGCDTEEIRRIYHLPV